MLLESDNKQPKRVGGWGGGWGGGACVAVWRVCINNAITAMCCVYVCYVYVCIVCSRPSARPSCFVGHLNSST